jgi:hypothetical protein
LDDDKEFTVKVRFKTIERAVKVKASDEIQAEKEAAKIIGGRKDRIAWMRVTSDDYGDGASYDSDWYPISEETRQFWD